jgi:hypothetical protein
MHESTAVGRTKQIKRLQQIKKSHEDTNRMVRWTVTVKTKKVIVHFMADCTLNGPNHKTSFLLILSISKRFLMTSTMISGEYKPINTL